MDNLNKIVRRVSVKKPPRRTCPRCHSHNTKFCNIIKASQPQCYLCKNCRRYWTHGGTLRNIPFGGRGRKTKCPKIDQPSVSQVSSVENHFVYLPVVLALPARSASPMSRMDVSDGSFHQGYYDVGSNDANQEDLNKQNQRFNNTMNKDHNAIPSGSRAHPAPDHMIKKNNNNV
ncbi:hypothetical protein N665_0206s0031 [Sinapis alba]|nr:hypothetical protein N665_0206s0031 [Sinapis alba]